MPRKSKAQSAQEARDARKALTPKQIRLKRRQAEKQTMGIVTDIPSYKEFKVKVRVTSAELQQAFVDNVVLYVPLVKNLVSAHMAISTSIKNVMDAVKDLHPDIDNSESLNDSIDKAWDLAATSMILEAAFVASGYSKEEARNFAQSIMLKREEPRPIHIKPPEQPKKPAGPDIEGMVKEVSDKLGMVLSREKKEPEKAPTRRARKQA